MKRMSTSFLIVIALLSLVKCQYPPISQGTFINSGTPPFVTLDFDCNMREFAYTFGKSLQPRQQEFVELFDALQLQSCNMSRPQSTHSKYRTKINTNTETAIGCQYYVDSAKGNDNNNGSISSPFKTIEHAISYSTSHRANNQQLCILYLREGVFYLENGPILITEIITKRK